VAALRLREGGTGDEAATDEAASTAQSEASVTPTARPYSEYRPEADVQKQLDASAAGTLMRPHLSSPPEVLAVQSTPSTLSGGQVHNISLSEAVPHAQQWHVTDLRVGMALFPAHERTRLTLAHTPVHCMHEP